MYVHKFTVGTGETKIIFICGFGLHHTAYYDFGTALAKYGYTVQICDLPPFGESRTTEVDFTAFCYLFRNELEREKATTNCIIIGHSAGALLASYVSGKKHIYLAPPVKIEFTITELRKRLSQSILVSGLKRIWRLPHMVFSAGRNIKPSFFSQHVENLFANVKLTDLTNRYRLGKIVWAQYEDVLPEQPTHIDVEMKKVHHNFPITHPKETAKIVHELIQGT